MTIKSGVMVATKASLFCGKTQSLTDVAVFPLDERPGGQSWQVALS